MRRGQSRFELVKKRLLSLHNRIGLKRTYQILFNTYALRISSIILLTRGRAVIKNPAEKGNFAAGHYGVPGAIRTRGLPLRRRMLYPAELRRQATCLLYRFAAQIARALLHVGACPIIIKVEQKQHRKIFRRTE